MNIQKPTFFYELCRLCLDAEGIYDIFETGNLLEDIYLCTGVIIFVSDKLPHKICIKCTEIIKNAKQFRVFVNQNDVHLRSLFIGNPKADIIKTIACHTPKKISEPENICEQVQHTDFENEDKEGSDQNKTKLNTKSNHESFLEGDPVVVKTISLRKDLFYSSSVSSCGESPSPTKTEYNKEADPHVQLLEQKVKIENICDKIKTDKDATEYFCSMCSKPFLTYKKFYLHQRLHNKKIVCPLHPCGKKFATKGDLEKHVRIHTGEKPYVCVFCKKGFAQRVSLRYHVGTKHPKNPAESEIILSDEHSV